MASDPTSSSLNISGTSSQSVLGGAVAVRSRSASSGHSSQHSTPRKRSNRKTNPSLVGALTRIPKAKSLMPPPPQSAMDFDVGDQIPSQSACAGISPQGEVERTTDVKILNQMVVGLNPNEVFAALQNQWERINFAESTANQVYEEASSVISQLRSQIQGLVDNHNVQMTQAHDRMMQEIGARDMRISQMTNETSQLQSMVEQLRSNLDRMTSDHQFQTNRLESELSQARVVDANQRETIRQLEERLAALRHTSAASTAIVKAPEPQVMVQREDQGQSRILEAIQHLSTRLDHFESQSKSQNYTEQRNPSSSASQSRRPPSLPLKPREPLLTGFPDRGDPGDGDGDGDDDGDWNEYEERSHDSEELVVESPAKEKDIVDSRALQHCRLDNLPNNASDFRAWKNSLYLTMANLDISGIDYLSSWISKAFKIGEDCTDSSELVPRLDRWLASQLLKAMKGVPELQFRVQGYIEKCTREGQAPRGRVILSMISRHFDLDRTRGSLLTSQSIFQVELSGYSTANLREFSSRVMYVLNSIPQEDWPSRRMLGEWLFHRLKQVRKLERVIDSIKRSAADSHRRDFEYLWDYLQEFLVEEREDQNALSIEASLKSKNLREQKPPPKISGAPAKAIPPKAAAESGDKSAPALAADPKGGPKGKGDKGEKGKGKGKGKVPLTAEEKSKTPCIFFQMPSGCVHGSNCQYAHVRADAPKNPPPKKNDKDGKAKAKAKSDPKSSPPKALAAVAILAASVLGANGFEFAADTGAGRHLISREALINQGADGLDFDRNTRVAGESLRFHTGGGTRNSSNSIGLRDDIFGTSNHFILDNCPFVRSVGVDVQQNGFGFVWMPGQLPFYIKDPSNCKIETPDSNKIYASRVAENVPFFKSNFQFIPGAAAIPGEEGDLVEEVVHRPDPPRAEEVRGVAPEEPLPLLSDAVVRARAEAVSLEHRISHFPKHPLCDVCNRAKLFSKRVRSHRVPDPESDLPESTQFGEQVAVDHMVVSKSSDGKEFLVLVVHDSFSGIINAYPTSSKGSDFVFSSLRHFVGHRCKNPDTVCRSDAAPELLKAIRDLGWLPETSLPRRWPHNARCERAIRSFEECCRCLHLQGGFATLPKLWPVTCRYAAVAISIPKWEQAFGTEFKGASYALGQLVFYRTKFQNKSKIAPNASPALMAGWKLEFGLRYKGVLTLLDYQALRQGKVVLVSAPDREVYARDKIVFPLADLAEKALENFSDPSIESLDPQEPLPIPFIDEEIRHKARRVYITYNRIQKIGMTPGCRACYAQSSNHTPECVARHEEAFGREIEEPPQHHPDELEDLFDDVAPNLDELEPFQEVDCDYSPTSEEVEEDVPECPLPGESEEEQEDPLAGIFAESSSQGGGFCCLGATANPEKKLSKHGKGKHKLIGKDVLFEFACAKDSNLGKVGQEYGIKVIRLCKESIDLEDPQSIDQLAAQVEALPGCSIHCAIECKPWSQWQHLNQARNPRLKARILAERAASEALVKQYIRIANICLRNGGDCSFEWPRYCSGWSLVVLQSWIVEKLLHSAVFSGCSVGVTAEGGLPAKKPWRFVTSSARLAQNLGSLKCTHERHAPLQGKYTRLSAFYPEPLCRIMIESLYPHITNQQVISMPCIANQNQSHRVRLVPSWPSIPLEVLMFESGIKSFRTPAYVHRLLSREEWRGRPEVQVAINSERDGLLLEGTWREDEILAKDVVVESARLKGETIHLASLMTIVSIKGFEKNPDEWRIKARVVFRGDAVKDQDGLGAIFQDLSASAPSSISGLNTVITFSMMPGNHCTTSDCIRAYIQSPLKTKHRTFVLLPPELVPQSKKHLKSPCAQLYKSLYGHPESSAHWQSHLSAVLQKQLGGVEFQNLPSVFWFDSMNLILSVYVDDLTLAGEESRRDSFWKTLKQHINLDPPTEFGRVLGRDHRLVKFEESRALALECSDFACQCVSLYEELSGVQAKPFRTPNCDEGSLVASNDETRGQLAGVAARLVMKLMWLCRIGRPDVMIGVVQCAKHVTCWSLNDDKRIQRIVGYLKSTSDYAHVIKISDVPSDLSLSLYCDADFGGDVKDMKSTSGFVLAIEGENSFALLGWGSKKQKVISRSTTESEFVSLSSALFQEAIPMLEVWQKLIPAINLVIHEDNTACIAILHKGYSPKLRSLSKTHRINVASTCEAITNSSDITVKHISTDKQKGDIMTKGLPVQKWSAALNMLNIVFQRLPDLE